MKFSSKLYLDIATHNFKGVKIIQIPQKKGYFFLTARIHKNKGPYN